MAGFRQDPIQFINLIADNLRDRYPTGFPVLKELIQNTDDAPATEMHYGLSSGLPKAEHPLLKGSGLFFINNGEFKKTDYDGIRSFCQNSKAADQGSIGKFGLGMKSVFHFCEAFFFLAHNDEKDYEEVLNPWSGPNESENIHHDWDEFSDHDIQAIRDHLSGITARMARTNEYFILWLPLRKKNHLRLPDGKSSGSIVSEYPGDDATLLAWLDEEGLAIQIAALLPMLQNLKQVDYWKLDGNDGVVDPVFEVKRGNDDQRPSLIETDQPDDYTAKPVSKELNGNICVKRGDAAHCLEYSGREYFAWNSKLKEMHEHELWPGSHVTDSLGHSSEVKDKARPHGAVFFSRTQGKGQLITNWAVFLPLDENHTMETIACTGEYEFRVTLHGYFFIDAGRQSIHGLKDSIDSETCSPFDSEEALRKAWNQEILCKVVLPLLLPALEKFCARLSISDEDCWALSSTLNNSRLFHDFKKDIAARYHWLREITPNGLMWVLRKNEKKVVYLPYTPEKDTGRPWQLFGSLKNISEKHFLSIEGAPNIIAPESKTEWSEEELSVLLQSVDHKALFSNSKLLDYFSKFLSSDSTRVYLGAAKVKKILANLVRRGLIDIGEQKLGENQKRIQEIIGHLNKEQRFKIDNQIDDSLLSQLLSIETDVILVPSRFFSSGLEHDNSLSIGDASELLKKIDEVLGDVNTSNQELKKAAIKLSEQFIKGVAVDSRSDLLRRCVDLHILGGHCCKIGQVIPVSVRDICSAKEKVLLFGYGQGTSGLERLKLALLLQKILPHDRVLIVNAETAKLATNAERSLLPCDRKAVLQCLGHEARVLGDMQARIELAEKTGNPDSPKESKGLRYLLHAASDNFSDVDSTLWILGDDQQPVWKKLWAQLEENDGDPWNLLNSEIANKLSREVSKEIGIKEIRAESVLEKIQERGFSALNLSSFDQKECEQILREVKDDDLWKSLPFHWTEQGEPVAGDLDNAYLNTDLTDIDKDLLQDVYLITCSRDRALAQRQKALLKPLNERAVIELILNHTEVPGSWRMIMDALQSLDSKYLSEPLRSKLRSTAWLHSDHRKWKPEDIIGLEGLDAELDRVLAQAPDTFTTPFRLHNNIKKHPFFPKLCSDYFSHKEEALERLALVIADLEIYQVGNINLDDADELKTTAKFLSSYEHAGWRLLHHLIEKMGPELCFTKLLPDMKKKQMQLESIMPLLIWISKQGKPSKKAIRIFNHYLKLFAGSPDAKDTMGQLKLLNKTGQWKPSGELVSGVAGVALVHLLDHEQACILFKLVFQEDIADKSPETHHDETARVDCCAQELRRYFTPWESHVAPSLIAAFVLLFGGNDKVKELCLDYLGQHSRDWLIDQIPWTSQQQIEQTGRRKWLYGKDLNESLNYLQMSVRVHRNRELQAFSILGKDIQVSLEKRFNTLFLGKPCYSSLSKQDGYQVELVLRNIDSDAWSDKQLSEYLKQSIVYLLTSNIFEQQSIALDELWRKIDVSDQVDIDLARNLMLENIPFYLKQLGAHKEPCLKDSIDAFREKERAEKEFKDTGKGSKCRKEKEDALKNLQHTIETDENAQQAILKSVRNKIGDYQYQQESVPFELFQNADDALHDLELIDAYPGEPGDPDVDPLPPTICRFVIEVGGKNIVFMHWGRTINQCGSSGFPGREEGFDRDLENMLILSASDKGENVTGKFGLGFKSVWLVSERPAIVSGRLQTEIVGGLLPGSLCAEINSQLREKLYEYEPERQWPGTAIKLPLANDVTGNQVLKQFSGVAGTMVAFARNIRTIELKPEEGVTLSVSWEGKLLPGCKNIFIGHVLQAGDDLLVMKVALNEATGSGLVSRISSNPSL